MNLFSGRFECQFPIKDLTRFHSYDEREIHLLLYKYWERKLMYILYSQSAPIHCNWRKYLQNLIHFQVHKSKAKSSHNKIGRMSMIAMNARWWMLMIMSFCTIRTNCTRRRRRRWQIWWTPWDFTHLQINTILLQGWILLRQHHHLYVLLVSFYEEITTILATTMIIRVMKLAIGSF